MHASLHVFVLARGLDVLLLELKELERTVKVVAVVSSR